MTEMICIVCPNGCKLQIEEKDGDISVSGHLCKKGIDFARTEMTNPTRAISSTVKTVFPDMPVLPVKTDREIPKGKLLEAMKRIREITVKERVKTGDILLEDVFGANIVATTSTKKPSGRRITD